MVYGIHGNTVFCVPMEMHANCCCHGNMFVVAVETVWLPRTMELHFPLMTRVEPVHLYMYTVCFGLVSVICSPFWFSWYSWSLQENTRVHKEFTREY